MRKAQLMVFAIIGILLLFVLFILFFLLGGVNHDSANSTVSEAESVNECARQAAERGLFLMGIHGGTIAPGEFENLSYALKGDSIIIKPKQRYEAELASYIDSELPKCAPIVKSADVRVTFAAKVIVEQENAYQLIEESQVATKSIQVEIQLDMARMIDLATLITERYAATGRFSDPILPTDVHDRGDAIVAIIKDPSARILGREYQFAFALDKRR
jgi:hypothetical protein